MTRYYKIKDPLDLDEYDKPMLEEILKSFNTLRKATKNKSLSKKIRGYLYNLIEYEENYILENWEKYISEEE